ncbi:hypothetical protein DLAC_09978 [Tieghemostelium lacteum]|uniref:SAM domain-containing protein n=1 Tax=Tieghemostelium lacteum TaxID=361077 RepID=A0A151Z5T6_TIELA|nr:hypothetical protein DLAC_09978 [Tieghemostelium lacteum]|eukprot:KYQ89319.1 hypothetical protein DLAC_09978 [Tieghemostelium lacteum]
MNNNYQTTETTTTASSIGTSNAQPPITQHQRDFRTWTIDEVYNWAMNLDFGVKIANILKQYGFCGKYLETITHEQLTKSYNMLGPECATLLSAINKLKETTQEGVENFTQFWLTLPQANSTHDTLTLLYPLNSFKSIYVRNCYRDFLEIIKEYLKMKEVNEPKMVNFTARLNISGDAGIGKSTFAPYLIYELQKGNPTSSIHTSLRDIPPMDSSQKLKTIYFVDGIKPLLTTLFFTVLTTSPSDKEIYKDFRKGAPGAPNKRTEVRYMPGWSWSEIETFCSINDINIESIKENYYIWGGIARYLFQQDISLSSPSCMDEALNNVDVRDLLRLSLLQNPDITHKVVHYTVNEKYELIGYHFASDYVSMKVYYTIESQTIPISFAEFLKNPDVAKSALYGKLYELGVHKQLATGEVYLTQNKTTKSWESLTILKSNSKTFDDKQFKDIEENNTYYVPKYSTMASIDSVYTPNIMFQITISTGHRSLPATTIVNMINRLRSLSNQQNFQLVCICPKIQGYEEKIQYCLTDLPEFRQWEISFITQSTSNNSDNYHILLQNKMDYINDQVKNIDIKKIEGEVKKKNYIEPEKTKSKIDKKIEEEKKKIEKNYNTIHANLTSDRKFQEFATTQFEIQYQLTQYVCQIPPPTNLHPPPATK